MPFPTLPQMEEIFPLLPSLPTPTMRPRTTGPPSAANATPATSLPPPPPPSPRGGILPWLRSLVSPAPSVPPPPPPVNTFLALKQGDRSLIVAVVDGGNVGWTRLGRGGFQEHVMVPNEML